MSSPPSPAPKSGRVVLAHGGGGELMNHLIRDHIVPPLANDVLNALSDGAVLPRPAGRLVFTTDTYVVTPLEFPGGDIGRLAVAGTVNDVAVMGARPQALSMGLVIEEGLPFEVLDRVMASVAATATEAGVAVVTGDTKVIERRRPADEQARAAADGLFINTAGVGTLDPAIQLGLEHIQPGDSVLVNGTIADHGLAVMSLRNGIEFDSPLCSDAAPLNGLIAGLLELGDGVRFLRDATRGGVAGVFADICDHCGLSVEIVEPRVPLSPTARHAAEMLGLDPLNVANEGKVVCVVAAEAAGDVLAAMHRHPLGRNAACIGSITAGTPALVELITRAGGRRIVQRPYGEDLPRIC